MPVSWSLTECSVHSDQKLQTNSPTFWEFLTNELVRSGWKEKYERLTERDPRGEAVSAKKTSTSTFRLCHVRLNSGSGTKRVISLSTFKGLVLGGRHTHTPTQQSLKTPSGSREIDSCFDSQGENPLLKQLQPKYFLI